MYVFYVCEIEIEEREGMGGRGEREREGVGESGRERSERRRVTESKVALPMYCTCRWVGVASSLLGHDFWLSNITS